MITSQDQIKTPTEQIMKSAKVGGLLKQTREKLHLSEKEIANRLHLKPKIIIAMENEHFDDQFPPIFIRGYFRAYAKFLNFSDHQITQMLAHLDLNISENKKHQSAKQYNDNNISWGMPAIVILSFIMIAIWWVENPHNFIKQKLWPEQNNMTTTENNTTATTQINPPDFGTAAAYATLSQKAEATHILPKNHPLINPHPSKSAVTNAASEEVNSNDSSDEDFPSKQPVQADANVNKTNVDLPEPGV